MDMNVSQTLARYPCFEQGNDITPPETFMTNDR